MEREIELSVQPLNKIVIFECNEFSNDDFFKRVELMVRAGHPIALNWADGIVFLSVPYQPNSDIIIKEALKGTMYLASVMYSSMPKYQAIKRIGAREILIIDQTPIPYLRKIAQWLKEKSKN